jgi:trehalose 6-phosphate phosphatase
MAMMRILSKSNRPVLQQFAWSSVLLAFDYDGTLAPIVTDPRQALMRPGTRALLGQLVLRYPCVVISGRAQADARERLDGIPVAEIIGNHGLEPWAGSERFVEEVRRWLPQLAQLAKALPGVRIEDKVFSVAVHYRRSREKKKARRAILRAAAALGPVRVIGGKAVVNILPHDAPHKGVALERERARLNCDTAIYVGDDETDEDVFTMDQPGRLLTIRVGSSAKSQATYCLLNQGEIDDFLKVLLELRPGSETQQRLGG